MGLKLLVQAASRDDVFQDIARIPESHRFDGKGRLVPEGKLCKLSTESGAVLVMVRGNSDHPGVDYIWLDERTRNRLGVKRGEIVDFTLSQAGLFSHVRWSLTASDTGYRVASWIALTSVALGLIGAALGILSLCR